MIFDMRLRPPYGSWLNNRIYTYTGYYPSHQGYPRPRSALDKSIDLLIQEMDESGITCGLIPGRSSNVWGDVDNQDIVELSRKYPGRFYGLWGLNAGKPKRSAREITTAIQQPGIVGVALEPTLDTGGPIKIDDATLNPIYEAAQSARVPLSISISGMMGPDLSYADPIAIQRVAVRFPDLKIIVSHGAWPWARELVAIAYFCLNVYVSPDQYLNTPNMPGSEAFIQAANVYLGSRLMWGSSYPSRPLRESVEDFKKTAIPAETQQKILYDNAAELFGVPKS
jgi:predicted TIM-barrel fold metal-dependent hydrolase